MKFLSFFMATMFMMSTGSAWAQGVVLNRILVKINDNIITQYDLDEKMRPILEKVRDRHLSTGEEQQLQQLRRKVVGDMINDILIQNEAERYGVTITDEDLDAEIDRVKKERNWDDETFEAEVAKDGVTVDGFREQLRELLRKQEIVQHMVNKKVLVTDSEIEKEYEARKGEYTLEKKVEVAIIMLSADVSAVEVKTRIEDGELTFAEAVKKYSVGPAIESGGSIGEMNYSDLSEEWKAGIRGVPEGGVSQPLNLSGSEALLSPVKIAENSTVPLEEVRDEIFQQLMREKHDKLFNDFFTKLEERAVIVFVDKSLMPENGVSQ